MKTYDGISIRSAASFREEARAALRGKWKSAFLLGLVILLMAGSIIGAEFTYSSAAETAFGLDQLTASIGPFTSISLWNEGRLFTDLWQSDGYYPIMIRYSPLFVAAAALTALFFIILSPIVSIAQVRLSNTLLDHQTPDFSIFHVSGRQYWLFVRTGLLAFWLAFWPTLILCFCAGLIAMFIPDMPILIALPIIAGVIIVLVRSLRYAATSYLVALRPEITAREAVRVSVQIMKGRRWRMVCLALSFIGWELLYTALLSIVQTVLNTTPVIIPAMLICPLAFVPLSIYITVSSTAFLRDADSRTNGQTPVSDMADNLISSDAAAAPEPLVQNEETPDDPWADDQK